MSVRCGATDWLAANVDHFVPQPRRPDADKPLLELLVFILCLLRRTPGQLSPAAELIVDRLAAHGQTEALRDRPVGNRNQLLLRAGVCALLRHRGRADAEHEALLQRAVDTGLLDQSDRLPHHILIERLILDWAGIGHSLPEPADVLRRSMLVQPPDALYQQTRSVYALTHDIMFGSALGERVLTELSPADVEGLRRVLGDLLVRFQIDGHWDLLGELVLSWDCLGFDHDAQYDDAWASLTAARDVDGSMIGIRPTSEREDRNDDADRRFRARYHTTLVLAMASLVRDHPPVPDTPVPARRPSCAARDPLDVDALWLHRLLCRADPVRKTRIAASAVVGFELLGARGAAVDAPVGDAIDVLRESACTPTQFVDVAATLTLLAAGLLRRRGIRVAALDGFVEVLAAALGGGAVGVDGNWDLHEKQSALAAAGLAIPPPDPELDDVWRHAFGFDGGDAAPLWRLALAASRHGTAAPRELSPDDGAGVRRLEALAMDRFRRTDLIGGCALIRAANGLRRLAPERAAAVMTFLSAQQLPSGGYGAVDMSAAAAGDVDADLDIRLPISLAVWWAQAELCTPFRLLAPSESASGG